GAAGQTGMCFGNDHRLGICTELASGGIAGLPYDINSQVTVEGYFNSGFTSAINYSTTVPARLYTDYRSRTALRLAVGLAPYTPPATSTGLYDAEPFDYTAGGPLHNQAGGTGFGGAWTQTAPSPTTPKNVISTDGSLSYTAADPNGAGLTWGTCGSCTAPFTAPVPTGQKIQTDGQFNAFRLLSHPVN